MTTFQQGAYKQALAQIGPQIDAWLESDEKGVVVVYDSEGKPSQALDNALLQLLGQENPANSTVAISAAEEMELFLRWKKDLDDPLEEEQAPGNRRPRI